MIDAPTTDAPIKTGEGMTESRAEFLKAYKASTTSGEPIKLTQADGTIKTIAPGEPDYQMHLTAKNLQIVHGASPADAMEAAKKIDANYKEIHKIQSGDLSAAQPDTGTTAPKTPFFKKIFGFGKSTPAPASPTPAASAA